MSFSKATTAEDVAAAYPQGIPGKSFLITGATSGLGLTLAEFFSKKGASTIIITGRTQEKLTEPVAKIQSAGKSTVKSVVMDLEDLESVKKAAAEVKSFGVSIDYVINNAGVMAVPYKKLNGHESQLAINHLAPFLFTNLIIDSVAKGGRILVISSGAHLYSPVKFDDITFEDGAKFEKWQAYGQSKSANILFAKSLTSKYHASKGIEAFSIHPGAIATKLSAHLDPVAEGFQDKDGNWNPQMLSMLVSVEQGIATQVYGCISPDIAGKGGAYLAECKIDAPGHPMSDEDAEKLWVISNKAVGTSF